MPDAATLDIVVKASLVMLGAGLGSFLTQYMSRRRLRNLTPLLLEHIDAAATLCSQSFTTAEAAAAGTALDAAYRFATDVVAAGIDKREWQVGARLIGETQAQAAAVAAGGQDRAPATTEALRLKGAELREWVLRGRRGATRLPR